MKPQSVENWEDQPRIDLQEKVTGRAKYVEDLPNLPGMVYGAALLSPYSHARILSIDSSKAEGLRGVHGVLHRECLDEFNPVLAAPRHEHFKLTPTKPLLPSIKSVLMVNSWHWLRPKTYGQRGALSSLLMSSIKGR